MAAGRQVNQPMRCFLTASWPILSCRASVYVKIDFRPWDLVYDHGGQEGAELICKGIRPFLECHKEAILADEVTWLHIELERSCMVHHDLWHMAMVDHASLHHSGAIHHRNQRDGQQGATVGFQLRTGAFS